jgi:hypothetical protein
MAVLLHHLLQAGRGGLDEVVGQQHGHRLAAGQMARAPDGMSEPERPLLPHEQHFAGRTDRCFHALQLCLAAAQAQGLVQFELMIEVVLDGALVAAGDEDEALDPRSRGLLDRILDQRLVDDRQHFLRHRLGRRQEARAEPRHGEDRHPRRCHGCLQS